MFIFANRVDGIRLHPIALNSERIVEFVPSFAQVDAGQTTQVYLDRTVRDGAAGSTTMIKIDIPFDELCGLLGAQGRRESVPAAA